SGTPPGPPYEKPGRGAKRFCFPVQLSSLTRFCRLLDFQVVENTFGGLTALEDRRDHQIGATHHVAASKDLRVAGLVLELAHFRRDDAPLIVGLDILLLEPRRRAWTEAEGDD